jgi:hypothetical protein
VTRRFNEQGGGSRREALERLRCTLAFGVAQSTAALPVGRVDFSASERGRTSISVHVDSPASLSSDPYHIGSEHPISFIGIRTKKNYFSNFANS